MKQLLRRLKRALDLVLHGEPRRPTVVLPARTRNARRPYRKPIRRARR